jgi:AAHS family 4-hydroxybenzoate transporter-like MFS transporter
MSEATAVNVPDLIDRQNISSFQVRVMLLCATVVFLDGFDAQAIGYVAPVLSKAWHLKRGALKDVFAAGLFGLMLGALISGPLADRFGRKVVILFSMLSFSIFTLCTVTAESMGSLLVWRFITGLGLGGAMPNAVALTSEYSPHRRRASLVMIMFCGFSLGAALGGVFAAELIPHFGWKGVFWLGGIVPLVLAPMVILSLPESIRLLALKGTKTEEVRKILARINAKLTFPPGTAFTAREERSSGFAVGQLFKESRALGTLLIWVMFFMNLLNLYFLASWLPTTINNAGIPVEKAALIASLLQIGGIVGVLSLGWLVDRLSPFPVLAGASMLAAIFIAGIGLSGSSVGLIILTVAGAGFCLVGGQIGATAMPAIYYPTTIRSTGVGWALGIGRAGSIVGPWVGGLILSLLWKTSSLFLIAACAALCSALAALLMGWTRASQAGANVRYAAALKTNEGK